MNENLLIRLLEPFQTERFKEQISKFPEEELQRVLIRVTAEIMQIDVLKERFKPKDPYDYLPLYELYFELYLGEKLPLIKGVVAKYAARELTKTTIQNPEKGYDRMILRAKIYENIELGESILYDMEIEKANRRITESFEYYKNYLLPLIEQLRADYISRQAKGFTHSQQNIEPLKWNGTKRQFAALLYELLDDPKNKGRLLGEGRGTEKDYANIVKHFVFKDRKTGEYKPETAARIAKYVSDIRIGYGSRDSKEEYKWLREEE